MAKKDDALSKLMEHSCPRLWLMEEQPFVTMKDLIKGREG